MTPPADASLSASGRTALRAGPLGLELDGGTLRFIRCGSREVVRGIYVAVRGPSWVTVPGTIEGLVVEGGADRFRARFRSRHRDGPLEFDWNAIIEGDETGTIRYEMDGEARSTFLKNRIGLCVLHPIDECAGQPCEVERADGEVVRGVFPRFVSPHQPFVGIRAIRHEIVPGLLAEVRFLGDVFEMEDHRNWSDASYKTYSTPLALPYPAEVRAGTRIRQSITLRIEGEARPRPVLISPSEPARVRVELTPSEASPRVGVGASTESEPPTEAERALLRSLCLDHLRVDLHLPSPAVEAELARAAADSRALGLPLEVALFLSDDPEADLQTLAEMARGHDLRVAIWLLFREATLTTTDGLVAQARRFLLPISPEARLGGGTDAYFADLNRARPSAAELDQLSFSLTPQAHAQDDTTIVQNLSSLHWVADTARAFAGSCPLALSPVTLRPRVRGSSFRPEAADSRHALPFGAAWTAGLLAAAGAAGFASLTLFEPTGPKGLVEGDVVHPLFEVLKNRGEMKGGVGFACSSDAPERVQALTWRKGGRIRTLVFNLMSDRQRVVVSGLPLRAETASVVGGAEGSEGPRPTTEGYRLELLPHEVVRFDAVAPGGTA